MIRVTSDKGYEPTTVADVIEAVGVSRTTFYKLFKDKGDCFLASYDAVVNVLVHHFQAAYSGPDRPWPQRVHAGLAALVEILSREAPIARMAMVEVIAAGPLSRQRYRDALSRFMPFLDEGRGWSEYGSMLPVSTSRLAIGGAAALIFDEIRAGHGAGLEKLLPDLAFAVLMPFIGPEAAVEELRRDPSR